MKTLGIAPTGHERHLGQSEFIVSKTDPKGLITYANDVFCRLADYSLPELIGQPHNVIRHPDMPRAVFKLLWDTISAGQEIFAYVVNMSRNGDHYWVFAHVTPTFSGRDIVGYHSNRRAPHPSAINAITPIYRKLCDIERQSGGGREALAASTTALETMLAEQAVSYDELVWSITP